MLSFESGNLESNKWTKSIHQGLDSPQCRGLVPPGSGIVVNLWPYGFGDTLRIAASTRVKSGATMRTELLRFNGGVERDPAIDA